MTVNIQKGFSGGAVVENHLPVRETWVQSLGQDHPLEKETVTRSCVLAWKIPWTEELVGYSPWDHKSQTRLSD